MVEMWLAGAKIDTATRGMLLQSQREETFLEPLDICLFVKGIGRDSDSDWVLVYELLKIKRAYDEKFVSESNLYVISPLSQIINIFYF
jgi:hypothetical protein